MKLYKYLLIGAVALGFTACDDEPHGISTKHPAGMEEPSEPSGNPDDDVVSPKASFSLANQKLTLSTSKTYQEIEGFGASDCWLPNQIGQYWSQTRMQIAQWLFSRSIAGDQPAGIGLSMWRVNLGGGTAEQGDAGLIDVNSRAECYLPPSGVYDWTKCAGQRYFMEQAKNNGVEKFVLFSNTPLVQYTINGKGFSENGANGNLKDECYGLYAEYMAEVALHFMEQGYNISHISPVNEPQYNWDGHNQEGSGWQNTEVARLTRELDAALESRRLSTAISVGEAGHWVCLTQIAGGDRGRSNTIDAFFNSSSEAYVGDLKHVDNICGHSYWTYDNWNDMRDARAKVKSAAEAKGVKVWQTEWSLLGDAPSEMGNYDDLSEFDLAMYMSRVIHNDLTVANVTSWSYWTAMSVERYGQKNRFELIKTTPSGGNYSDDFTTDGTVEATHNLWVLGNYSRFIRPGFRRVDVAHNESKDFFVSAYMAPDNSQLVVVVTNYDASKGATLDMETPEGVKSIYRYTTTSLKHLEQTRFNLADKVFVDPASVTTIVYNF